MLGNIASPKQRTIYCHFAADIQRPEIGSHDPEGRSGGVFYSLGSALAMGGTGHGVDERLGLREAMLLFFCRGGH